jgi:hypothetical protein
MLWTSLTYLLLLSLNIFLPYCYYEGFIQA